MHRIWASHDYQYSSYEGFIKQAVLPVGLYSAAATIAPASCKSWLAGLPVPKIWLIFGHGVKRPGDLDLWPFDLGTGAECQPWHGQPSCQFQCFCDFSLSSYGQTRVKLTTWRYNLDLWCVRSPRMSVMWVIMHTTSVYQVWSS